MSLRLGSLAMKMLLMLYMGKYLGLYDIGTYGLVAAVIAISIPVFGIRLEYVISREIVESSPGKLVVKLRDEFLFYIFNYFFLVLGALLWTLLLSPEMSLKIIVLITVICILEGLSTVASSNLVALGRPILSNFVFFLRSSLWVVPAIIFGLYDPSFRTVETILILWASGVALSLVVVVYAWRNLPWHIALSKKFNRRQLYSDLRKTLPIWVGEISMAASIYVNRFVTEYFLDREYVGIISFYGAFTIAIHSLIASGVFAFAYPKMISMHKNKEYESLSSLTKKITIQAVVFCLFLSFIIGIAIPIIGDFIERPEFRENAYILWLLLFSTCISILTSSLYHLAYARHQDWVIWGGNLLLLALSSFFNILMISKFGFVGVGYSAIIVASAIGIWLSYCTVIYNKRQRSLS